MYLFFFYCKILLLFIINMYFSCFIICRYFKVNAYCYITSLVKQLGLRERFTELQYKESPIRAFNISMSPLFSGSLFKCTVNMLLFTVTSRSVYIAILRRALSNWAYENDSPNAMEIHP